MVIFGDDEILISQIRSKLSIRFRWNRQTVLGLEIKRNPTAMFSFHMDITSKESSNSVSRA